MRGDWKYEAEQYRDIDRAIMKEIEETMTTQTEMTDLSRYTRNHAAESGATRAAEQYAALLEVAESLRAENARLREALREVETICTESAADCRKRMGTRSGNCIAVARAALKVQP